MKIQEQIRTHTVTKYVNLGIGTVFKSETTGQYYMKTSSLENGIETALNLTDGLYVGRIASFKADDPVIPVESPILTMM